MNKSKSLSWKNITGANRSWQGTRLRACSETRIAPRSQQCTQTLDTRTNHHKAPRARWIIGWDHSPYCRRVARGLENRTQTADHSSRTTTRPHANSLDPALHTIALKNRGADTFWRQQAVENSFEQAKEAIREDPTPDARWALCRWHEGTSQNLL